MAESNDRVKPIKQFRAGKVKASVWEHRKKSADGKDYIDHSISLQKSYKPKDKDEYVTTSTFFPDELPKVILVMQKAYEFVACAETSPQNESREPGE